ncbi:MAG: rRNA adenine N-6-methyltransferase family protein [Microthrixaceae bacterium]
MKIAVRASARLAGPVAAEVFHPRPRVESVLVELTPRRGPRVEVAAGSLAALDLVLRAGFGQRRKTLRRSLAGTVTPEILVAAGIDPGARAEQVDVAEWLRLARLVADQGCLRSCP